MSIVSLAKQLDITVRMLKDSVYEYQALNLDVYGLGIIIKDQQIVPRRSVHFSFNKLKQVLIKRSLNFKLCQKIFLGEFTNILEFSEENFISIASMYRNVKILRAVLTKYHLELNLSQEPIIKGQEYHIRHFYFELYFAAYGLTEEYLPTVQCQTNYQKVSLLETAFPIKQKIRLLYYISFSRMKEDFYMSDVTYVKPYKSFIFEEKLTAFYVKDLVMIGANEEQIKSELNFFLIYVLNIGIFDSEKLAQLDFYASDNNQELNEKISRVRKWTSFFASFFDLQLSMEMRLFLYANLYIYFISEELFPYTTVDFTDLLAKYKEENPYLWHKTLEFEEQLKVAHPEINVSAYLTHFFVREIVCLRKEQIEICLFFSCSHSRSRMIEREIKKRTAAQVTITRKITEETKLIVSDLEFELGNIQSENQPEMIFIQTDPSESDYKLISELILKLSQ